MKQNVQRIAFYSAYYCKRFRVLACSNKHVTQNSKKFKTMKLFTNPGLDA